MTAAPDTTPDTAATPTTSCGRLFGVGVGPGDPELLTLKAARLLDEVAVVAYFAARGRPSNARRTVEAHLDGRHDELRLEYPVTTETLPPTVSYETLLIDCYDESAKRIAERLDAGLDVAVVCEGDPFFYGSYMYLHSRLADRYRTEVVPGVPSPVAGAAVIGSPLACRDEMLSILSGVLPVDELERRLRAADAAVVMKVGRNLAKVRDAVTRAGLLEHAIYVERATMADERTCALADADGSGAPYFSMVVIPSRAAPTR
ncbi:MAG TPA: precorrin-2 C(20)-methyltransferase [Acidimicrobiia bacterium]|nr:precorrin-2 C(20)-methyltransferase [Acidimicrobiia bacterium]